MPGAFQSCIRVFDCILSDAPRRSPKRPKADDGRAFVIIFYQLNSEPRGVIIAMIYRDFIARPAKYVRGHDVFESVGLITGADIHAMRRY